MKISFHPDAKAGDISIMHHLKLYENENAPNNPKKPVVSETFEEVVFSEPPESFYARVAPALMAPRPAQPLSCQAQLPPIDDAEEAEKLKECRARVAAMVGELRKEYETVR